jgi:hypothetical protein
MAKGDVPDLVQLCDVIRFGIDLLGVVNTTREVTADGRMAWELDLEEGR